VGGASTPWSTGLQRLPGPEIVNKFVSVLVLGNKTAYAVTYRDTILLCAKYSIYCNTVNFVFFLIKQGLSLKSHLKILGNIITFTPINNRTSVDELPELKNERY
jgi:hypothetical protein